MSTVEEVIGGGITGGGASGASGVVRALTRLGLRRTMEGLAGFTTDLNSSSRNT